ncbi:MAG: hypothetical protein HW414_513 [Dehalococcoidia bacterium]|nr:hypothetical protein [Dehalococcoidia bacterium]
MHCGCIAVGDLTCTSCQQTIKHAQRYLVNYDEAGKKERLCLSCCLEKGCAQKQKEKGEDMLTFFGG